MMDFDWLDLSFFSHIAGILFGIVATGLVTYLREEKAQRRRVVREDALRAAQQEREDKLRADQQEREDKLRAELRAREDRLRADQQFEWVSQRWWERKASAYTEIVDAVWHIRERASDAIEQMYAHQDGTSHTSLPLDRDFLKDRRDLKKLADIGQFVISDEVAAALSELRRKVDAVEDHPDIDIEIETHFKAAKECLSVITPAALRDLGITRSGDEA